MRFGIIFFFFLWHRYETEEIFFALNVTVKNATLQDSLDQFVKGELLEGDNAYFCEKCGEKVSMPNCQLVFSIQLFSFFDAGNCNSFKWQKIFPMMKYLFESIYLNFHVRKWVKITHICLIWAQIFSSHYFEHTFHSQYKWFGRSLKQIKNGNSRDQKNEG